MPEKLPKSFKLLAIRPGRTCENNYLKVLKAGQVYSFYNNYKFNEDGSVITVEPSTLNDLYSFSFADDQEQVKLKKIAVNLSAVVGGNGSGKSTLMELLFLAIYNIGCEEGLLKNPKTKKSYSKKNLDINMFYQTEAGYFRLSCEGTNIYRQMYEQHLPPTVGSTLNETWVVGGLKEKDNWKKGEDLKTFFYTIAVNYSHHALNSREIGPWIDPLFHKNDGYQTPLVINPMREEGNININRENDLLRSRLLSNLLEPVKPEEEKESLRNLANGKIAVALNVTYNSSKTEYRQGDDIHMDQYDLRRKIILESLLQVFGIDFENLPFVWKEGVLNYIINKGYRICKKYPEYDQQLNSYGQWASFLKKIRTDTSHVAFKIKQAIYFLKYDLLNLREVNILGPYSAKYSLSELSERIQLIKKEEKQWEAEQVRNNTGRKSKETIPELSTMELLPPPFFTSEVVLKDEIPFSSLSSGEKQKIHAVSSLAYHIINLNSVRKEAKIKFSNIHIVLDEIELYYHPEWQRVFVNDLLTYLQNINRKYLVDISGINIQFITHSPFILSDIPDSNVLFLRKERPNDPTCKSLPEKPNIRTLGGNIHEMLVNGFFMRSSMGEFNTQRVKEVISFYHEVNEASGQKLIALGVEYEQKKSAFRELVEMQGEKVVKSTLGNHLAYLDEQFSPENLRDAKINFALEANDNQEGNTDA